MPEELPNIPGSEEYSWIEFAIQRAKARRKANGEISGLRCTVLAELRGTTDGERYWVVEVRTSGPLGNDTFSRAYETRVDAYALFEWYLNRHDELEELEGLTQTQHDPAAGEGGES